ncbi:hypothetical protein BX600DRAFT_430326 [Xylariales sp. PMI_506]|nr:hypothetical protein BX600DRAFT_430326 [Xylariales sp. PMI_506]
MSIVALVVMAAHAAFSGSHHNNSTSQSKYDRSRNHYGQACSQDVRYAGPAGPAYASMNNSGTRQNYSSYDSEPCVASMTRREYKRYRKAEKRERRFQRRYGCGEEACYTAGPLRQRVGLLSAQQQPSPPSALPPTQMLPPYQPTQQQQQQYPQAPAYDRALSASVDNYMAEPSSTDEFNDQPPALRGSGRASQRTEICGGTSSGEQRKRSEANAMKVPRTWEMVG